MGATKRSVHRAIEPPTFPWGDPGRYTFSLGLDTAGDVYLCGLTASSYDPASGRVTVEGDVTSQLGVIYDKIGHILAVAGLGMADVTDVIEYVAADVADDHARLREVRRERLGASRPAIASICVDSLLRPDASVEISVAARGCRPTPGRVVTDEVHRLASIVPDPDATSFQAQVASVLDQADDQLHERRLDWTHVVFALEHVVMRPDGPVPATCLDRNDRIRPGRPAGARIQVSRLVAPHARVQLDLLLSSRPVEVIVDGGVERGGPAALAPAVRAGRSLYVSGQHGIDGRGREHQPVVAQAERAYQRLLELVELAGFAREQLVDTVEHVTGRGLADYARSADIRRRRLDRPFPVATGTVCRALDAGADFVVYGLAQLAEAD